MGKKENPRMLQFFTRTTRSFIDQVKMVVPTYSIFTKAYKCMYRVWIKKSYIVRTQNKSLKKLPNIFFTF